MKISVICVYNNEHQLNNQLLASLNKQDVEFEFIAVDNINHRFHSAAEALNYGASQSNSDVLIFTHQDIFIKQTSGLREFANIVMNGEVGNIYGSSGARETENNNIGAYTSGKAYDEKIYDNTTSIQSVSCLDECFFGMKVETYQKYKFNEVLCNDWHLYCVEMCLKARKSGKDVCVIPIQVHHFSKGTVSWNYMKCLKKVAGVYRKDFKYIWTTVYKVRTSRIYINLLLCAWYLNRRIRRRPI